jgi:hypothetical protein
MKNIERLLKPTKIVKRFSLLPRGQGALLALNGALSGRFLNKIEKQRNRDRTVEKLSGSVPLL